MTSKRIGPGSSRPEGATAEQQPAPPRKLNRRSEDSLEADIEPRNQRVGQRAAGKRNVEIALCAAALIAVVGAEPQ